MRKQLKTTAISILFALALALLSGCGGGGDVIESASAGVETISGAVQTPGGTTAGRQAASAAGALANVNTAVVVRLYVLDDDGTETALGSPAATDDNGGFVISVPVGYSHVTHRLIVSTTIGSVRLRTLVPSASVAVSPVSEAAFQYISEQLDAAGKDFGDLAASEIAAIEDEIADAMSGETFAGAATVSDAVTISKTAIARDADVSASIATSMNTDPPTTLAVFTTTDYSSGALSYIALTGDMTAAPAATPNVKTIFSDTNIVSDGAYVYIINRFGSDSITVLDPSNGFSLVAEYSTGSGSNPYDIEFVSASKAYVSRYAKNSILIVNPATGAELGTIDLSAFADADGLPEMSEMVKVGNYIFVTIQNLENWAPARSGRMVVVDTATDSVVDADPATAGTQAVSLNGWNPQYVVYNETVGRIFISCAGNYFDPSTPGGIDSLDPAALTVTTVVDKGGMNGSPGDIAVASSSRGYVVLSDSNFVNRIYSFNPATGAVGTAAVYTAGGYVAAIAIDPFGYLVISDGSYTNPGAVFIDTVTDEVAQGPIGTGMGASAVAFVQF